MRCFATSIIGSRVVSSTAWCNAFLPSSTLLTAFMPWRSKNAICSELRRGCCHKGTATAIGWAARVATAVGRRATAAGVATSAGRPAAALGVATVVGQLAATPPCWVVPPQWELGWGGLPQWEPPPCWAACWAAFSEPP